MKIGICNDHSGVELKKAIAARLEAAGHKMVNFGTDSDLSADYPDFAHRLAAAVEDGEVDAGIALCGTGNGMAMTLNKYRHIRAVLAWNREIGRLASAHNKANVLVLPARFITTDEAFATVDKWLVTPFDGGRHLRRLNKILP